VLRRSPVTMELEKLRRFRAKVSPDLSLYEDVDELFRTFSKQQRSVGLLNDLWKDIAPAQFFERASIKRLSSSGVLTILASDSAAAYEFDQWLRGGGLTTLKKRCKATLKSVKIEQ